MPEVDRVIGNAEKLTEAAWTALTTRVLVGDIMAVRETAGHLVEGFEGRARAFVQVQKGCDHRCTFCIIPYGRGNSRSAPIGEIVDQVARPGRKRLCRGRADRGRHHQLRRGPAGPARPSASWCGACWPQVPELPRLRLSSIDCIEIDGDLMRLIENEPRLMPHLHLSLQAGDDLILKRMKRRHSRADAIDVPAPRIRARRPDVVFGADLIAGFPTEDGGTMFQQLARPGRRMRPDVAARLPLFGTARHAGGAHAAGARPGSGANARRGCGALGETASRIGSFSTASIGEPPPFWSERSGTVRDATEHNAPIRLPSGQHCRTGASSRPPYAYHRAATAMR